MRKLLLLVGLAPDELEAVVVVPVGGRLLVFGNGNRGRTGRAAAGTENSFDIITSITNLRGAT